MTRLKRSLVSAIALAAIFNAGPGFSDPDAGSYLSARQALVAHDFAQASARLSRALISDPSDAYLLENAMTSYIGLGDIKRALPIANDIVDQGYESQVANLTVLIASTKAGDWQIVLDTLDAGRNVGPLVDGLAKAWAHLGAGDMTSAIAGFDAVISAEGMMVYGMTHKAYALASVGDFEAADAIFASQIPGGMRFSRQSAIAYAQILSQLGRNDDALRMLDAVFGAQLDPSVIALRQRLAEDEAVAYTAVRTPAQALGDLCHVIAGIVQEDAPAPFTLMYARAAMYLWPENTAAVLMTARLLEELGQHDLANVAFASVSRDDPSFHVAELGRAEVLRTAGQQDAAITVLEALTRSHPDLPEVYAAMADTLRQAERYGDAIEAYTRALTLYQENQSARWFVHYARGISHHKLDDWPNAEADFRAALALRPDHPQVLNYLGYSLVERNEKLDEALGMIETAAAARPDNGAIVDSLGWVYFQLGRYEDAVFHLERAASLEPVDPVINDHLGDAFWAVGREIEARFQWNRALSFDPDQEDAMRIRDKLERGLDMVLVDEGLDPIRMAGGDD